MALKMKVRCNVLQSRGLLSEPVFWKQPFPFRPNLDADRRTGPSRRARLRPR